MAAFWASVSGRSSTLASLSFSRRRCIASSNALLGASSDIGCSVTGMSGAAGWFHVGCIGPPLAHQLLRGFRMARGLNPETVRLSAGRDLDERVAEGGPVADVTQAVAGEGVDAGPVVRPVPERRRHHARQDAVGHACAVG